MNSKRSLKNSFTIFTIIISLLFIFLLFSCDLLDSIFGESINDKDDQKETKETIENNNLARIDKETLKGTWVIEDEDIKITIMFNGSNGTVDIYSEPLDIDVNLVVDLEYTNHGEINYVVGSGYIGQEFIDFLCGTGAYQNRGASNYIYDLAISYGESEEDAKGTAKSVKELFEGLVPSEKIAIPWIIQNLVISETEGSFETYFGFQMIVRSLPVHLAPLGVSIPLANSIKIFILRFINLEELERYSVTAIKQ